MTALSWHRQKARSGKAAGEAESQEFRLYYHYFLNENKTMMERQNFKTILYMIKEKLEAKSELSIQEQKHADRFLISKVVKGGKVHVEFNRQAIEEEIRDYGIFCLISNVDKDPWVALKNYRTRNLIENSYRVIKSDLDGRKPREWSVTRERGKEVCRLIALGLKLYLYEAFDAVRLRALARSSDEERYNAAQRKSYGELAKWLENRTMGQILAWYDCVETVRVSNDRGNIRWRTESIQRDRLFMEMLKDL